MILTQKSMDLAKYLHRIGFAGEVRPDVATLKSLQRAHLLAVPYENFDVQLRRPVGLDINATYEKIVLRGRGGWCYEMNGLLGWALATIGFRVTRLAATTHAPASHLVLHVDVDEPYACDAGLGDGPIEPYRVVEGAFSQHGFDFRVEFLDGSGWRLHKHRYSFVKHCDVGTSDEDAMARCCVWQQTSLDSRLWQNAVAYRFMQTGFISLIGRALRIVRPEGVTMTLVESAEEYVSILKARFGIDLPEAAELWPSICQRHDVLFSSAAATASPAG
jgi:N-hydroxyarylamine O-acetyltransferase